MNVWQKLLRFLLIMQVILMCVAYIENSISPMLVICCSVSVICTLVADIFSKN